MARLLRLLVAVLFPAALLGGAGLAGAGSAVASPLPLDQCTTTSGVILAVDFGPFGGGVYRACGSTPTTGLALLKQGGWSTAGTQHDGPAFVCRIGYAGFTGGTQYPTASTEKCVSTPPASHYWSYWHANPGDTTWSYSTSGAATYQPQPGSVDAWVYGGTDVAGSTGGPSFSPDSVRAHNTSAPGGGSGSGAGGSGSGSGSGTGGSGGGGSGTGGSDGTGTTGTAGTGSGSAGTVSGGQPGPASHGSGTSVPSGSQSSAAGRTAAHRPSPSKKPTAGRTSPTPTGSTSEPAVVDAQPVASVRHSSGSLLPVLITAAIIVVIAGFIGVQVWTRKQANRQL